MDRQKEKMERLLDYLARRIVKTQQELLEMEEAFRVGASGATSRQFFLVMEQQKSKLATLKAEFAILSGTAVSGMYFNREIRKRTEDLALAG